MCCNCIEQNEVKPKTATATGQHQEKRNRPENSYRVTCLRQELDRAMENRGRYQINGGVPRG